MIEATHPVELVVLIAISLTSRSDGTCNNVLPLPRSATQESLTR